LFGSIKRIPEKYRDEYVKKLAQLIKSRVFLFGILAIVIYSVVDLIDFIFMGGFEKAEIPAWILLILGTLVILFFNSKAKTLKQAKLSAYILTAFLLVVLTKVSLIYYTYMGMASTMFLFLLFLVSFTIPWEPFEIIPITCMHLGALSCLLYYFNKFVSMKMNQSDDWYYDGLVLISMGFVLAFIVRAKETKWHIGNFLLLKDVEAKNEQMRLELELATRVHKTLIPKSISTNKVDIAVTYLPMQYIGGDYAKFQFIDNDKLLFMIGDITGHGVSAALLVNRLHIEFDRLIKEEIQPGVVLSKLNDFILKDFEGIHMYLSAFCGLLDFKQEKLSYSNHGHPTQYIYRIKNAEITRLESQASMLGLPITDKGIYQHEIDFSQGDKLLLFTDGVIETKNESKQEYGEKRLEEFVRKNHTLLADLFNRRLLDELNMFKSGDFEDDIFVLNINIK